MLRDLGGTLPDDEVVLAAHLIQEQGILLDVLNQLLWLVLDDVPLLSLVAFLWLQTVLVNTGLLDEKVGVLLLYVLVYRVTRNTGALPGCSTLEVGVSARASLMTDKD